MEEDSMPVFVGKLGLDATGLRFFKRAAVALSICLVGGEFIFSTPFGARILFEVLRAEGDDGLVVKAAPAAFYRPGRFGLLKDFAPNLVALSVSDHVAHEIVGSMWYALKYGY
jgi:hypothetical protein